MAEENKEGDLEIQLLTCSATEYAIMSERNLSAYEPIGINSRNQSDDEAYLIEKAKKKGCVAVVDIRSVTRGSGFYLIGTGLKIKSDAQKAGEE